MKKRTNPLGKGKINISTTVPEQLNDQLKALAIKSAIPSRNRYVLGLLELAVKNQWIIREETQTCYTIDPM